MNTYYVYIITTINHKMLYVGITNNLERRLYEHKNKLIKGFTFKYNINKIIYYEECSDINIAINREKQLKGRSRIKKNKLISSINHDWEELISV